jgi:hypothetical protein
MEKELRKRLLACKTQHDFDMVVYDFIANTTYLSEWLDINLIFTENQKAWKDKLVNSIKFLIDEGVEGRDISFNDDFSKFKVYSVKVVEKFNPKIYKNIQTNEQEPTLEGVAR